MAELRHKDLAEEHSEFTASTIEPYGSDHGLPEVMPPVPVDERRPKD